MPCVFCEGDGGTVLWRDARLRVIHAAVEGHPWFLRVILNRHVPEMSDLDPPERAALMRVVFAAEQTLREACTPVKMNLASFGNQVPHLHWHVVARFADDPHYPEPPFGAPVRRGAPRAAADASGLAARLTELLAG